VKVFSAVNKRIRIGGSPSVSLQKASCTGARVILIGEGNDTRPVETPASARGGNPARAWPGNSQVSLGFRIDLYWRDG